MTWRYEIDVGTLSGEVEAEDRDAALDAAMQREIRLAPGTLGASTWMLREVHDD